MWELIGAALSLVQQVFSPSSAIEVIEQDGLQLILKSGRQETVLHKRHRTVKRGSKVLALFDGIESIDIQRRGGDESPETWAVRLRLKGFSSIAIGESTDPTDASIAAARLSTWTGAKVRSL